MYWLADVLEGIVAPFVVAEYCGSFKMLRSDGLELNGTKTVVTILSLINILDDGRGVYCARIVMHIPEYVGDYIHHWDLVNDGPMFEIISERDTCCQCKLFFNTTCDFAYQMQDHHEGQEAFRKLPRRHNQYNIFETTEIKGGERAGHHRD